jgi:hypothetical protein
MVVGSNLCPFGGHDQWRSDRRVFESLSFWGQWWCSARSWVRIFDFLDVNGGEVHGPGFESLIFEGQWWCSAWPWVRIFEFWGSMVVMHGRGFESLTFGAQSWCSARSWVRIIEFWGQWWCSAWSWVRIFDFFWSMVV